MKMHLQNCFLRNVINVFSLCVLFPLISFAVAPPDYPDTLWIPVTFYDFHSDRSNPEFEITPSPPTGGRQINMVADTLDPDQKPVVGSTPYFNQRIDRWFRSWEPGDSIIYNYFYTGSDFEDRYRIYQDLGPGLVRLDHDTSFINMTFEDSLPFILINQTTGTYQFSREDFFPLDGRGFGNEGRANNFSFAMELHWEFSKVPGLTFSFRGDDDVWAFVGGRLRMDIGGIHEPVQDSFNLDQESDLIDYEKYTLDFFYVERHVHGSNIQITTNILSPIVSFDLDVYPNDTVCPYTPVTLESVVTDDVSGERPDLSQTTRWRVLDLNGQSEDALSDTIGSLVTFTPDVAYSRVILEGVVFDGKDTLRDTITIQVDTCEAYKIYIEANPVDTTDTTSLRYPQELAQISILDTMVRGHGYAIARDRSGAYVRLADAVNTVWEITPDGRSFADAVGATDSTYYGIVTRTGQEGNTYATATEQPLLPDSVLVIIAPYYIVRLQLRDKVTGEIVDSIVMSTDEIGQYEVWGLKSTAQNAADDSSWVLTNATWVMTSPTIVTRIPPPSRATEWLLDPTAPGRGTLTLTNPDEARTDTLVVPVTITRAPADSVAIVLISSQPYFAGDTIEAEVSIYNSDGLVPGEYCFGTDGDDPNQAAYSDTLGTGGGRRPDPTITVDGVDMKLNVLNGTDYKTDQCFTGGKDTVKIVLYYAPVATDSLHQITVFFGTDLTAKTKRFRLYGAELDSLAIEDVNHVPLPPQTLTGIESVTPYSAGYDQYGNSLDFQVSTWSTTGTLSPIDDVNKFTYITAEDVSEDQAGNVCATAYRPSDSLPIKACLQVTIIGPKKQIMSAVTRDLNGDGGLDAIDLHFDRAVGQDELSTANFSRMTYLETSNDFTADSIAAIDSMNYRVYISQKNPPYNPYSRENSKPQTDWILQFSFSGSATIADNSTVVPTDGAGPVIWKVTKYIPENRIVVELSEPVRNVNGDEIDADDDPSLTFNVYSRNTATGKFDTLTVLEGINNFSAVSGTKLTFDMSNDSTQDLSTHHWMNLEVHPSVVEDRSGNEPHFDNIKRNVGTEGQENDLELAPNPTRASFELTDPGYIDLTSREEHWQYPREKKGALIRVHFTPPDDSTTVSATIKIYDMVGNLVTYFHVEDFMAYLILTNSLLNQEEATNLVLDHYWNGSNRQGMKVAPGVYRVVYYIDYASSKYEDVKLVEILGISKDP